MTAAPEDLRPDRLEVQLSAGRSSAPAGERCRCAHGVGLHDADDGACLVELPPFDEEEMPAWRCPCRKYAAADYPGVPWRWHEPTQSWTLPRTEPAA